MPEPFEDGRLSPSVSLRNPSRLSRYDPTDRENEADFIEPSTALTPREALLSHRERDRGLATPTSVPYHHSAAVPGTGTGGVSGGNPKGGGEHTRRASYTSKQPVTVRRSAAPTPGNERVREEYLLFFLSLLLYGLIMTCYSTKQYNKIFHTQILIQPI